MMKAEFAVKCYVVQYCMIGQVAAQIKLIEYLGWI